MQIRTYLIALAAAFALLAGCDRLGIPDKGKEAAERDADARAVGAGCRHAGRAIEDCYALNPKDDRAQVFSGWKEMDDYMRSNKIDVVKPEIANNTPPADMVTEDAADDGKSDSNADAKAEKSDKKDKSDKTEKSAKSNKKE